MDASKVGRSVRALRVRANLRQADVETAAGVPRAVVARIERGDLAGVRLGQLLAVAGSLDADLEVLIRWNGTELDRLVNAGHSAMHEVAAGVLLAAGWEAVPERSFSIWGERGVVDILAWHPSTRTLLVVELKTEIVDVQRLIGTVDRYRRLAAEIVKDLGWIPDTVGAWSPSRTAPRTDAGWRSTRLCCERRSRRTAAPSRAGSAPRPGRFAPCRSSQMLAWRTVSQLAPRAAGSGSPR